MYGYNFEKIPYPFKDNPHFQAMYLQRLQGIYNLPVLPLIPDYNDAMKCKHCERFTSSSSNLFKECQNIVIYSEMGERVLDISVYSRRSSGSCKCLQRVDGTQFLLWNLGHGRFIDFTLLYSYVQKWTNSGMKIFALWLQYNKYISVLWNFLQLDI